MLINRIIDLLIMYDMRWQVIFFWEMLLYKAWSNFSSLVCKKKSDDESAAQIAIYSTVIFYARHLIHIYHSAVHSDSAFHRKFQPKAIIIRFSRTQSWSTNTLYILDGYSILTFNLWLYCRTAMRHFRMFYSCSISLCTVMFPACLIQKFWRQPIFINAMNSRSALISSNWFIVLMLS